MNASRHTYASHFSQSGKLPGESLDTTWASKVCSVFKFPWGATGGLSKEPVAKCHFEFSQDAAHWKKENWHDGNREACQRGR